MFHTTREMLDAIYDDAEKLASGENTIQDISTKRVLDVSNDELASYLNIVAAKAMVNQQSNFLVDIWKHVNKDGKDDIKGR